MIGLRFPPGSLPDNFTATELWIPDEAFEPWVRDGRISPETLVWSADFGQATWRPAGELEVFYLFRPEPEPGPPPPGLADRLFPRSGFSGVELLLMSNILVAVGLLAVWQGGYGTELLTQLVHWHKQISRPWDFWRVVPTIFMHADAGHLMSNLVALLATGGAVEYFYGRRLTWFVYLTTGVMAAMFSYFGHARPPLSVGASGAIFGLAGVMVAFLFRFYRRFSRRQRWRTRRIYAPLALLLVLPAMVRADYYGHAGGFLTGILLGLWLPLDYRAEALLEPRTSDAMGASDPPADYSPS